MPGVEVVRERPGFFGAAWAEAPSLAEQAVEKDFHSLLPSL